MAKLCNFNLWVSKYPKPPVKFYYKASGFKAKASLLNSTMFRVAVLATLRSQYLRNQTVGIMITASDGPPEDNGVRIIDPMVGHIYIQTNNTFQNSNQLKTNPIDFLLGRIA